MHEEPLTPDEIETYRWIQENQPESCSAPMVARLLATIDQLRIEYTALEQKHAEADWEARGEYA
jgi:hypothetical protein